MNYKKYTTKLFVMLYLPCVLFSQNEVQPSETVEHDIDITIGIQRVKVKDGIFKIREGNNWGYEVNGVIKIPVVYSELGPYDSLYIAAEKTENEKTYAGIISSENETIIPFDYFSTIVNVGYHTFTVYYKGAWGIIDLDNKPLVNFIHTFCSTIKLSKYPSIIYACYDFKPSRIILYDSIGTIINSLPDIQSIKKIDENIILFKALI